MNSSPRNRVTAKLAMAERAHQRATGDGLGDIALHIKVRMCSAMMGDLTNQLLAPHGLTTVGYITMMTLYSRNDSSANPSELCDSTGETRGNMTRICDDLVAKGWMRRVPSAEDRRRIDLSLTDEGIRLLKTVVPELGGLANEFYKGLFTKEEKASLHDMLGRLSDALAGLG